MKKFLFVFLTSFLCVTQAFAETYNIGNGRTVNSTKTSYKMTWNEKSRNGGTVNGYISGPIKDGKRNGTWIINVSFNLFGDDEFRSGKITMTRNYTDGKPNGKYSYDYDINWREGWRTLNKWMYDEPNLRIKETVSGGFKNGRPDGTWVIRSDRRGGYNGDIKFSNGLPVGEHKEWESIIGTTREEFDDEGFRYKVYLDDSDNGWTYDKSEIPADIIYNIPASRFFKHPAEDDYYYFARGGEMAAWLSSFPEHASNEIPEVIGTWVELNGSNKDKPYRKHFGSSEYLQSVEKSIHSDKLQQKMWEIRTANDTLNELERKIIDTCLREGVINKEESKVLLSVTNSYERRNNDYCTPASILNDRFKIKRNEMLVKYFQTHPEIESLTHDPLVDELITSDDYWQRDAAKTFKDLTRLLSTEELAAIQAKKKKNEEDVRSLMKKAGISDVLINENIEEALKIYEQGSKTFNGSKFLVNIKVFSYSAPSKRYVCLIETAPSDWKYFIRSLRMKEPIKLESLNEITYEDFVVYTILENLKIKTSYQEVTPGGRLASHKYKLEDPKKWPDQAEMLERFSNLKSKFPEDYNLEMINFECSSEDGLRQKQTISEWRKKLGEEKLQKQWEKFIKRYKLSSTH